MILTKIVADSLPPHEVRLTTFSLVYPRFIHSEVMTHRALSRNAASSRAIPVKKVLEQIENDPALPIYWGKNQKGMQASEELTGKDKEDALHEILEIRNRTLKGVKRLEEIGLHKQSANRYSEPFQFMQTVITATDWDNLFNLRTETAAQPEFKALAESMLQALNNHEPRMVKTGYWHLPYVTEEERRYVDIETLKKYSTARCARVSYMTHEGVLNPTRDIERHDELLSSGHLSPFEHQAQAYLAPEYRSGNFRGWIQYRKTLPNPYELECKRLVKWKYRQEDVYE